MTSISDTLTVGLVLVLLFGSIALYLYTCIQQSEQKISLLESILLDLKMSNEIKSYSELPADDTHSSTMHAVTVPATPATPISSLVSPKQDNVYVPFSDDEETVDTGIDTLVDVEELTSVEESKTEEVVLVNYDSMSLKELQALAKSRGITGLTKKGALVDALKAADETVKPSSLGAVGSNSFLETSAIVSDADA
jgi:hypothetical protein